MLLGATVRSSISLLLTVAVMRLPEPGEPAPGEARLTPTCTAPDMSQQYNHRRHGHSSTLGYLLHQPMPLVDRQCVLE